MLDVCNRDLYFVGGALSRWWKTLILILVITTVYLFSGFGPIEFSL